MGGFRLETDSSGSGLELGDRLLRVGDRDLGNVGYIGFHAIGLSLTTPGHPVPLRAELPLPDAVFYGSLCLESQVFTAGLFYIHNLR